MVPTSSCTQLWKASLQIRVQVCMCVRVFVPFFSALIRHCLAPLAMWYTGEMRTSFITHLTSQFVPCISKRCDCRWTNCLSTLYVLTSIGQAGVIPLGLTASYFYVTRKFGTSENHLWFTFSIGATLVYVIHFASVWFSMVIAGVLGHVNEANSITVEALLNMGLAMSGALGGATVIVNYSITYYLTLLKFTIATSLFIGGFQVRTDLLYPEG